MKSNQNIVVRENKEQAEAFISQLEEKYLPAIKNLSDRLKNLGIAISKDLIYSAIGGNSEAVRSAYRPIIEAEKNKLSSSLLSGVLDTSLNDTVRDFMSSVSGQFSVFVGNSSTDITAQSFEELTLSGEKWGKIPMSSLSLSQFVELDDNGVPFINDNAKESIRAAFCDYANTSEAKALKAQKEAAKALNDFISSLRDLGVNVDLYLSINFVALFKKHFNFNQGDDGKITITERIEGIR